MTREDIIRIALEVGYPLALYGDGPYLPPMLVLLLEKAVVAEREACAKVCEELDNSVYRTDCEDCAAAIRARGQA